MPLQAKLTSRYRRREWHNLDGVPYSDYVCRDCQSVVPDTEQGCITCQRAVLRAKQAAEAQRVKKESNI